MVVFDIFWGWISIFLRIIFVGCTVCCAVYLIYSIVQCFNALKINKLKGHKIKIGILIVVLCASILLGYTEPPAKVNVNMDTVTQAFHYVKNNNTYSNGKNFKTNEMFGWVSYWDAEKSERIIREIQMSGEEKAESINVYPTYIFYGEVDGIEVYYEETKCKRWATLGHIPVDLLGVPDDIDYGISTMVYLISNNECVAVSVNYSGFNPFFFLQYLNSPYFFYSPEIDFENIVPQIKNQTDNQTNY